MKRLAAHYILLSPSEDFKLHYIELTDDNRWVGIFPLDHEIAQTTFYNGALIVKTLLGEGKRLPEPEDPVEVFHLNTTDLAAAKLRADDCSSHSNIQRLC